MRFGFTLVELLVSIATIGLLLAILVPATQAVRESARLTSCKNKQRQLSLAALNFESANLKFPPGQLMTPSSVDTSQLVGHLILLLPFIDQEPLFDDLKAESPHAWRIQAEGAPWYQLEGLVAISSSTVVSSFRCPADGYDGDKRWLFCSKYFNGFSEPFVPFRFPTPQPFWTNYLGSSGSVSIREKGDFVLNANQGIFFENSEVRTAQVTDGMSNTILFGEAVGGLASDTNLNSVLVNSRHSMFQNGLGGLFGYFSDRSNSGDFSTKNLRSMFSSSHFGGSFAVFSRCDGSVNSYPSETSFHVLDALLTRSGSENVSD